MQEKTRDRIIYLILALGVVFLRVFYVNRAKGPFVWTDELAYWGYAANLSGNSWAGVMNGMPWYAFGYSLFLVPLFLLTDDIVLMGRLAILLNAFFSVLSFCLAVQVVRRLSDAQKAIVIGLTAFAATSFSAAVFQSYIAWGETLLSLLVWLILYAVLRLEEVPSFGKGFLIGILAGYAFMVHNRMIAVVGAVFLTLFLMIFLKKIQMKQMAGFLLAFVAAFLVYSILKQEMRALILTDAGLRDLGIETGIARANTFSDQVQKIRALFTTEGMTAFLANLMGQIWHFLSAAYLLSGFGILFCVKKTVEISRKEKNGLVSPYVLPLLMAAATMVMTALFFVEGSAVDGRGRIDTYFYGRYNDILLPFFVAAGLCFLRNLMLTDRFSFVGLILCGGLYLAASLCVYVRVGRFEDFFLNTVSAASIYIFHWLGEFAVWKCVLTAAGVGGLLAAASLVMKKTRFEKAGYGMLCLGVSLLFAATAFFCMRTVIRGETDYIMMHSPLYEYLNQSTSKGERVYTLSKGKSAYDLQSRLVSKQVIPIEASMAAQIPEGSYLFLAVEDIALLENIAWESCVEMTDYMVVRRTGQAVQ